MGGGGWKLAWGCLEVGVLEGEESVGYLVGLMLGSCTVTIGVGGVEIRGKPGGSLLGLLWGEWGRVGVVENVGWVGCKKALWEGEEFGLGWGKETCGMEKLVLKEVKWGGGLGGIDVGRRFEGWDVGGV